MEDLEGAYQKAMDAEGSALKENETYLDSIEGRISQFNNAVQTLWMNALDSGLVKGFVQLGTIIVQTINKIGALGTALAGLALYKGIGALINNFSDLKNGIVLLVKYSTESQRSIFSLVKELIALSINTKLANSELVKYAIDNKLVSISNIESATTTELFGAALLGLKAKAIAAGKALLAFAAANPFLFVAAGIAAAVAAFAAWYQATESLDAHEEKLNEAKSKYDEITNSLQSLNDELKTTQQRMKELEAIENPSFADEEEYKALVKQNDELKRKIALEKILQKEAQKETNKTFVETMDKYANDYKTFDENDNVLDNKEYAQSRLDDYSTYKEEYSYWADIVDQQLKAKEEAEEKGEKFDDSELKNAKENMKKKEELMSKASKDVIEFYNKISEYAQDVNYIENPQTEDEKAVNAWLDFISNFGDRMAIAMDIEGKAAFDAFKRVANKSEFTDEFERLKTDANLTAESLATMYEQDEGMQSFIDSLIECGFIADTSAESLQRVVDAVQKVGEIRTIGNVDTTGTIQSYNTLSESVAKYNDALLAAKDIQLNNTKISEDLYNTLAEQIGNQEELNKVIDTSAGYVIKDAQGLQKLLKASSANTKENIKLAKSQARLQYYELYKETKKLGAGTKDLSKETRDQINALYDQMDAVAQTISRYSTLEQQLLGTNNAFNKFSEAQNADSELDYMSNIESMTQALGEAFQSAELGTQAAQAAIKALVPESVYADLDTVEEKMAAIYKYFKENLSKVMTIKYDDDGLIESVQMTLNNVKNIIEENLNENGAQIFIGDDWKNIQFSESFLKELEASDDKLQTLANSLNVTKEVAFSILAEFERRDINWLGGDYQTLLDEFSDDAFERGIQRRIAAIAEYERKVANGIKVTQEETEAYNKNKIALQEDADVARERAMAYSEAASEYETTKNAIEKLLQTIKNKNEQGLDTSLEVTQLQVLQDKLIELGKIMGDNEVSTFVIQFVVDGIDASIQEIETKWPGIRDLITTDEATGKFVVGIEAETDGDQKILDEYVSLLNDKQTLSVQLDSGTQTALDVINDIKLTLNDILEAIKSNPNFTIDTSEAESAIENIGNMIPEEYETKWKITLEASGIVGRLLSNSKTVTPNNNNSGGGGGSGGFANGTAHAQGSWGAPKTETALTGELGEEIVVRDGKWFTVGENGAEFTDIKKGDIIFNHKQSEELLSKGYVTGRGKTVGGNKAFASGTAYANIEIVNDGGGYTSSTTSKRNTPITNLNRKINELEEELRVMNTLYTNAYNAASEKGKKSGSGSSSKDFKEALDWFEILIEEVDEKLGFLEAKLENVASVQDKNSILSEMIDANKSKLSDLGKGIKLYSDYASNLLNKIPKQYRAMAQDGAVAIKDFAGDAGEKTVEAIENYREWAKKVEDLKVQFQETKSAVTELARQKFDNIKTSYEQKISLIIDENDLKEAQIDLYSFAGGKVDSGLFDDIVKNTLEQKRKLEAEARALTNELNDAIKNGHIEKGSEEWYEMKNAINEVNISIVECTKSAAEFSKQKFDNIQTEFEQKITLKTNANDISQAMIDLTELKGEHVDSGIYEDMIQNTIEQKKILQSELAALQAALNESVSSGVIKEGSEAWLDMQNAINDVKLSIIDCNKSTEEYANTILELDWHKFEDASAAIDRVSDSFRNFRDMIPDDVAFDENANLTLEGVTAIGLEVAAMGQAIKKSRLLDKQVKQLNKDYKDGKYSLDEYNEKLKDLTDQQWDCIKSIQAAISSLISLNQQKIDVAKEGIQKEIDAYTKLIQKRKEALDAQKEAHDFERNVRDKQKEVTDIQRQLTAMAGDDSLSGQALRKQLQAELKKAQDELDELFYDNNIDTQQDMLDKALEAFTEDKEAQIKALEEQQKTLDNMLGRLSSILGAIGYIKDILASNSIADGINSVLGNKNQSIGIKGSNGGFSSLIMETVGEDNLKNNLKEVTKQSDDLFSSVGKIFNNIGSKFNAITKNLFSTFKDVLGDFGDSANSFFITTFPEISGIFSNISTSISGFFDNIIPNIFGGNIFDVVSGGISTIIGNISSALGLNGSGGLLGMISSALGIDGNGGLFGMITSALGSIAGDGFLGAIINAIGSIDGSGFLGGVISVIGDALNGAAGIVGMVAAAIFALNPEGIYEMVTSITTEISQFMQELGIGEYLQGLTEDIMGFLQESGIIDFLKQTIQFIFDIVQRIGAFIEESGLGQLISDTLQLIFELVDMIANFIVESGIVEIIEEAAKLIVSIIQGIVTFLRESGILDLIRTTLQIIAEVVKAVCDFIGPIIKALCDLIGPLIEGLCNFIRPIVKGISDAILSVWNFIKGIWEGIWGLLADIGNALLGWLGIHFDKPGEEKPKEGNGGNGNGGTNNSNKNENKGFWQSGGAAVDHLFGGKEDEKGFWESAGEVVDTVVDAIFNPVGTLLKLFGFASGTTGVKQSGPAMIDELGEELVLNVEGGKIRYLTKGTSVIPADITENLMDWGQLNPTNMLSQNTPSVGVPVVDNNNTVVNMNIGNVVNIEHADNNSIDNISRAVQTELDSYMKKMNQGLKRYAR